jgi:hypothetical protein
MAGTCKSSASKCIKDEPKINDLFSTNNFGILLGQFDVSEGLKIRVTMCGKYFGSNVHNYRSRAYKRRFAFAFWVFDRPK